MAIEGVPVAVLSTDSSRSWRRVRVFITAVLALSAINFSLPAANAALPGKATITSITSSASSTGPTDVTVNFTRPDSNAATGILYSTNNGNSWAQCDSVFCQWTTVTSTSFVLKKLSSANARLQYDDTYQIIFMLCQTGSPDNNNSTTSSYASLPLSNCGPTTDSISYSGRLGIQSTVSRSIATTGTIANGASAPTVTITSTGFETQTSLDSFTVNTGTTGLTFASATFVDTSTITLGFTGTADYGSITIQAKATAFAPNASAATNTLTINVPAGLPAAPTAIDSSSVTGGDITLTWTAPANRAGAATTGYWIQYKVGAGGTWDTFTVAANTSTTRLITPLSSSTAYYFQIAAKNSIGYGSFSSVFGPVTTGATPTVPETPTAVSASNPTSSSLDVSWTAPANNGGATIIDYKIEKSTDGITWVSAATGAASGHTVTGLSASTSYYFRVAARNSVGYGPFSDSSTVVSTSAAPAPSGPAPTVIYPPQIVKLNKDKVCARGDDKLVIHGNNLDNATVTVDGNPVKIRNNSSQVIGVTLDEGLEGLHVIKVTTSAGSDQISVLYKMVDKTAFKVFDIPYIYKGGSFYYQFEAFGENTFRVTGNMPAGLVLNAETGEISGIPTEEGMFNFVLHADGLCGNDNDVIKLDVDKEIPNAISYRIKFSDPKKKKIVGTEAFELKKFLQEIKKISPRQIQPVIYITGGSPDDESQLDSQSAKDRRDSLCDLMINQDVIGQTVLGLFDGEEGEIEIFVYWPVIR